MSQCPPHHNFCNKTPSIELLKIQNFENGIPCDLFKDFQMFHMLCFYIKCLFSINRSVLRHKQYFCFIFTFIFVTNLYTLQHKKSFLKLNPSF